MTCLGFAAHTPVVGASESRETPSDLKLFLCIKQLTLPTETLWLRKTNQSTNANENHVSMLDYCVFGL